MTRKQAAHRRDQLAAEISCPPDLLRGSLLRRMVRHSTGCRKCAGGGGHPLWVLNVGYPGGKTRQVSLRPEQVPQVRKALQHYRQYRRRMEALSETNQLLLKLDREERKEQAS
jgi:hypothetical protein